MRAKWRWCLPYCFPNLCLVLWINGLDCQSPPRGGLGVTALEAAVLLLPFLFPAYVCGKREWKSLWLTGNACNLLCSAALLCAAPGVRGPGREAVLQASPWEFELLFLLFCAGLYVQWISYRLGKESRKRGGPEADRPGAAAGSGTERGRGRKTR